MYTLLFGTQLGLGTKLAYLMTAHMYYAPNGGFTADDTSFYENKVLHDMLQFQIDRPYYYLNYQKRYYHTSL